MKMSEKFWVVFWAMLLALYFVTSHLDRKKQDETNEIRREAIELQSEHNSLLEKQINRMCYER